MNTLLRHACLLLAAPALLLGGSCAAPARGGEPPLTVVAHPAYQEAFSAVKLALDTDDLDVARATLARLEGRLRRDAQTLPTLKEARERSETDDLAARVLGGELPAAENARAGLDMAEAFGEVIEGRRIMEALDVDVTLERTGGSDTAALRLECSSGWTHPVELRPGAATVTLHRTSVFKDTGAEETERTTIPVAAPGALRLEPGARDGATLLEVPVEVPKGAMATRLRASVRFNGGHLDVGEQRLPARAFDVGPALRTDLPGWMPAGALGPDALLAAIKRGNPPLNAALERAVRIPEARREEALDLLADAVQTMPAGALRTSIPALRWLAQAASAHRDEEAWRQFLIQRVEGRTGGPPR